MEDISNNVSYLHPRNPSIYLRNRILGAEKTNLLSRFGDEAHFSKDEKVKIYLRIKPTEKDEVEMSAPPQGQLFEVINSQTLLARSLNSDHQFKFTKVFSGNTSQAHVYKECIHDLVKDFISGQSCLLFAYGTSSAGKTYTIQGTPQEPGLIPRAITVLFNSIHGKQSESCRFKPDMVTGVVKLDDKAVKQESACKQHIMAWVHNKNHVFDSKISGTTSGKAPGCASSSMDSEVISNLFCDMQEQLNTSLLVNTEGTGPVFSVWVSFVELYNENLYDLLESGGSGRQKRENLALGVDSKGQVYIKGLQHICVNSADEAYQVLSYGQHNLTFAATGLNTLSSRSHCIFTIKLLQYVESEDPKSVQISTFACCDLAGAESAKKTQNVGERLKESQSINTSLFNLGQCLKTIRNNQMKKSKKLVPFRLSKLTRLFQRALAGKESLTMIVNINPSLLLREETFNVLMFTTIAKQIFVPTRHKKCVSRLSSFPQFVSKSSNLVSKCTFEGDSASLSQSSSRDNWHHHSQIEDLKNENAALKKQLVEERETRLAREIQVRQELCDYFASLIAKERTEFASQLEEVVHKCDQMNDWKLKKLEDYYKKELKRKQHCVDDNSEEGSSTLEDTEEEVACLSEKLRVANEFLDASKKDYNELQKKYSAIMLELSWCQAQLKNAEKLKEAAEATCDGDQKCLISKLESQLAAVNEELFKKDEKIKELNGILEDAVLDYKQLRDDMKAKEKERDELELQLAEKGSELGQSLDAFSEQRQILDKQLCDLVEKDEQIEVLEKQLKELQVRYDGDMKTMRLRTQELEAEQKILLEERQFTSEADELNNKLQETAEKLLQSEALQQIYQEELQKSKHVITDLKNQLNSHVEAEENNRKEKINSQNCTEELRKRLEESTITSQKEISELKTQLKTCMSNEEFLRCLKGKLEEKLHIYEELESANESLKRSLEVKEIELTRFKENRDQLLKTYENMLKKKNEEAERCKRDIQGYQQKFLKNTPTANKSQHEEKKQKLNEDLDKKFKTCCVVLHRLGEKPVKHESEHGEPQVTLLCDSSQINERSHRTRSQKTVADENTSPCALGSLDKKHTSDSRSRTLRKRPGSKEESKPRSKRKNLFSSNLDVSIEITPVETEEMACALSPARILRSHRL